MKRNIVTFKKVAVLATLASSLVLGCELVVDFDRTRIPVEGTDATVADGNAPTEDTGVPDSGPDLDAADPDAADAGEDLDASDGSVEDADAE